jgi:2-polyprenyl-6-methoxyphenol hydroxylase-like FAD-dependent oxidoreductase
MYDVIVVGARVAGASTAMLLARNGLRVLAVDRARFPSDTISTHQVQLPGGARLARWGLLDRLVAAGTPPTRRVRFDAGSMVLDGHFPAFEGVDALHSPRRTLLDKTLVDAARDTGAEIREGFAVDEIVVEGGHITGIRGRERGGRSVTESASLVVGADGKHSVVARAVGASSYREQPTLAACYYSYWEGVQMDGGEMHSLRCRAIGAWPTNDGLTMICVFLPMGEFAAFRADIEGNVLRTLDLVDLGERVRAGRRAERMYGSSDNPNRFRTSAGPGWALAGDAGLCMDPITGHGIAHALRDAELLTTAVTDGLGGRRPIQEALAHYGKERDRQTGPIYDFTLQLARFGPASPEQEVLFEALAAGPQSDIDQFLGVITGAVPMRQFLTPRNLIRLIGWRGVARIARGHALRPRTRAVEQPTPAGA